MEYRQILLAVDLTEYSDTVGRRAAAVATAFGADIALLHVIEYVPMDPAGEGVMPPSPDIEPELLASARPRMAELAARIGLADARQEVVIGSVRSEIVRTARELDADLIVLGRHQRHGLASLLSSTEKSLVRAAPCDVLAVQIQDR